MNIWYSCEGGSGPPVEAEILGMKLKGDRLQDSTYLLKRKVGTGWQIIEVPHGHIFWPYSEPKSLGEGPWTHQELLENFLDTAGIPFTRWLSGSDVVLEPCDDIITGFAGSGVHFEFNDGELKHVLISPGQR